jgi:AcrR family transcriptional regulator
LVSRQLVIDSALKIIDAEGLAALSLRRLAQEVGVNVGSLYHHYRYKDDILRDVLIHVLAPLGRDHGPIADWKEYFLRRSRTYVQVMVEHPALAPLMFELLPRTYGLPVEEQAIGVMRDAGIPLRYAVLVREQLESIIRGVVQFTYDAPLFAEIPDSCPELFAAVAAADRTTAQERVEFAVRALLDGVEQRIPEWDALRQSSHRVK